MSTHLPAGTVTFLFTDIEGSTRLLQELGDGYAEVLAEHHRVLREVWAQHGGAEVETAGDAFFVAFTQASDALVAAEVAQVALGGGPVRVRMGAHTGEPLLTETGYVGLDVHRAARIAAAAHGGQVLVSEATRRLVDMPLRDLGLHRLKDLTAPERLFQLGEAVFPTLRTLFVTNLPIQPNLLVGRERELEDLAALIREGNRLVTLTGAGGCGKTRLALHVAAELVELFTDGVWFVPLASVADPSLVEPTIAQTLGVRGELRDDVRSKRLLLILDNFEQILDAAPAVAALLAEAPGVHVLATSRERLAVAAEREYPVPTLPAVEAASLFTERARRIVPSFQPSDEVVEIARRLDGLPLAVELAAARVKVLTPRQILERLGRGLDLLTGGGRDVPERQRTLRATIEWSYELLSDDERDLFTRLGVFPSSLDLRAAEEVVGASLDDLAALIEKSLVRSTESGRYFMLETIRSFAVERLEAGSDADALRRTHAAHYARLAEELEAGLRDARQLGVIDRLAAEQPNIRAALETLHEAQDPRAEAALAADCSYFWFLTGQLREGLSRLQTAYDRVQGHDGRELGRAANGLALMCFMTGDVDSSRRYAAEALVASRSHDDVPGMLRAYIGKLGAAVSSEEMRRLAQEGVDLAREAGERWYLAVGLCNAGVAERELGNFERSRELVLQSLELAEEVGDLQVVIGCLCNAAHADLLLDDLSAAERRFREALTLLVERPLPEMTIWCLDGLASIAARNGDAEWGARLFGAAEALVASTSYNHPETLIELNRTRAALEEALGAERVAALRGEGAGLELAAIIELALTDARTTDSAPRSGRRTPSARGS